jgi:hypothetical protein
MMSIRTILLAALAAALLATGCSKSGKGGGGASPVDYAFRPNGGAEHRQADAAFNSAGTAGLAVWTEASTSFTLESRILYSVYSAGAWSAEAELAVQAEDAHVATDGTRFMVVWSGLENGIRSVYARLYGASVWGAVATLESATGQAFHPRVASNGSGFCAAWSQHDGAAYRAYASLFTTAWEVSPTRLDAASGAFEPEIASDGSGYAVTWIQADGDVGANVYALSGTWHWLGAAVVNDTAGSCASPRIASNGGSYAVAWYRSDVIYASACAAAVWGAEQTISPAGSCGFPRIVSSGSNYCIAWPQAGAGGFDLYANVSSGAAWLPANAVAVDATAGNALDASVASTGAGFAVAWVQDEGGPLYVNHVSLYGGSWTAPAVVATGLGSCHDTPAVRRLDATTYALVWTQATGTDAAAPLAVFARSLTTGGTFGTETRLVQGAWYGSSLAPQVAVNVASGTALAVWEQYHNGTKGVYGSLYAAGAWGTPAVIEDRGEAPVVTGDGAGFLAAWIRDGNDVRARRYVPATGWGAAATVDASVETVSALKVASNGTTACVVWQQKSGTKQSILASLLTLASSTWSGAADIDTTDAADCSAPRIAAAGSRYGVAWTQDDGVDVHVYASVHDVAWGAPAHVDNGTATDAATPDIASDGAGLCATWIQSDRVHVNRWTTTAAWTTATARTIDSATGSNRKTPRVASHGTDRFCVAWIENDYVVANAYDGIDWQTDAALIETISGASDEPRIAGSGTGYAVTWRKLSGGRHDLYGNVLAGGSWSTTSLLLEGLDRDVDAKTALVYDGAYYLSLHAQYEPADPLLWQIQQVLFRR